jgi:hypothetical protein
MLDQETAGSAYFAWHTTDIPGLHDEDGNPTEELWAYKEALKEPPMMTLKDAEKAADWVLGAPWTPADAPNHIDQWGADQEWGRYEFGMAYRQGSSVWQLPHVGPGGKFRLVPA